MSKKKNVICCVSLLLLVLLLSQSKMLEMMINTSLGRMILLALIVLLSYMNKIAGVVGVLLVIIMFNSSNLRLRLEGFDTKDPAAVAATDDKKEDKKEDKEEPEEKDEKKKTALAAEGFDIIGLENNIKRGKQSNSIPVKDRSTNMDDDVYAFEGTSMFGFFSPW